MSNKVKLDNTVKVHYTGKLVDGTVFDSSKDRDPLEFKVGVGQMIKGFENGVIGMSVKETKTITIEPEDAYGPIREELIQEIERTQLPKEINPEVGMDLVSRHPNGYEQLIKVVEVKKNTVVLDANHALAGKTLSFDLELVEIAE
ncbi:peptidylprolyl isomerase [Bacteroidota bacterium]